jgi:hypothetical protein
MMCSASLSKRLGFNPINPTIKAIMHPTQQSRNKLPLELTDAVKAKVESWLVDEVAPAYDAIEADPTRAVSIDEIRANIAK